ncbi:MAG: protein translocase subunit SecF, partial [Patescibacteria group bacterium]
MLNIIQNRKYYFLISGIVIAASIAALFIWGLKWGIDFTGGSLLEVSFQDQVAPAAEVREKLVSLGIRESVIQPIGEKGLLLRLPVIDEARHQDIFKELFKSFGTEEKSFESVGPTLGKEMRVKASWSIFIVLLAIISYIAFAFRKVSYPVVSWKYGVNAVVALAHDVIIPLGLFAVLGQYLNVEINGALVAAMLTILGFSVHDTIV